MTMTMTRMTSSSNAPTGCLAAVILGLLAWAIPGAIGMVGYYVASYLGLL